MISGQYDISLSSFLYQEKRSRVLSFSTLITAELVLVATPNVPNIDFGLVLRPLTTSAWRGIVGVLLVTYLVTFITKFRDSDETPPYQRILSISTCTLFVLLNSFYGGAMTMFFANDITLPFENIRDVIRAYPKWELLVFKGAEPTYTTYVEQGDVDYKALMDRIGSDPENLIYDTMEEGIMRLRNGHTVIHVSPEGFNSFISKNPQVPANQRLFIFGQEKLSEPLGLMFTLNSPLRPLFDRAITRLREGGAYEFLKRRW